MTRTFTTSQAKRVQVNLIIGLVGPSSSGKTFTALELATGIQSVTGGDIEMIDTEHERGLFYADKFKFNHTPFGAPFASLDYLSAIREASKRSKIIIVDSMSHEHESEGGMIDYQEQELTRLTRGEDSKRQAMQMLAWAKPKAARRKLLQGLTQVDAHLILCFRAKNSSKPGKDEKGKSVVVPMGFVPIAGEEFVFESALSMLFHPNAKGVPTWSPDMPGERIAVKLPAQFEWLAQRGGPVTRQDGAKLAEWARGGAPAQKREQPRQEAPEPPPADPDAIPDELPVDSEYGEMLEIQIASATDGAAFGKWFNAEIKTPGCMEFREAHPDRFDALKKKAHAKAAALREHAA
jgi:hypothetical protein